MRERLELPRLGLGTAPLAGLYEAVDEATAQAVLSQAWALGIRYFDTAPYYGSGLAEQRLGRALCRWPRNELVVSTKVGRLLRPGRSAFEGAAALEAYFDFSREGVLRSLEASLERLGLDHIDLALVHDPDDNYVQARDEALPALTQLRDEGVVAAIGAGMNQSGLLARFAREVDVDCFLLAGRYTVLDRSGGDELLPLCEEVGIAVIAGGVFNSGVLAGGTTYDYAPAAPEVLEHVERLRATCARWDVPLEAAAVQFPLRHPAVASVLVGCRTPEEVAEDVRLSRVEIPDRLWAELA